MVSESHESGVQQLLWTYSMLDEARTLAHGVPCGSHSPRALGAGRGRTNGTALDQFDDIG